MRILIFAFCVLSFNSPSHAATYLDPTLKWKTLETEHFSINYYPDLEEMAKRLAPITERVYDRLTNVMKYKLDMKTQVTIMDITDYGNGLTTVIPYPDITLYLSDLSGNLNPYKYDDYLYYLFLHEYTHALHLDIAEGGVSIFRTIFGRWIFPNALEPGFMLEGIATYMETQYTNAGRGRDPRWQMMMRMDVLENNLKSIDQAAVDTVRWPLGELRYLYGVGFLQYLVDTYGEAKLVNLAHFYGDLFFSVGLDGAFGYIYQKNLGQLWKDWQADLSAKFKNQKAKLGKLTEPKLLTQSGYQNVEPKWSSDSRSIYYLQNNADDYPQIRRLDLATGQSKILFEGLVNDEAMSLSPDGGQLFFSKADIYKNYYIYKDLYALDLGSGRLARLTEGLRASDPAVSPDGKRIAYIKNEKGERKLEIMNIAGPETKVFAGSSYFSPAFSPDGKSILAAKRLAGGEQRICLVEPQSGKENFLTGNYRISGESVTEADPTFSPDGKYILFDADYTGIVNLYAYDVETARIFRLTNVIGGAMMPAVSPDGRQVAYVSYSSRGYDIALMAFDPTGWQAVPPASTALNFARSSYEPTAAGEEKLNIHDYNPFPSLLPKFWVPFSTYNDNGPQTMIYLAGIDPLRQHYYLANFGYDTVGWKPFYDFTYINNQFLPQVTVQLADLSAPYSWNGGTVTYWERQRTEAIYFTLINNRVFKEYDRFYVTAGLKAVNLTNLTSLEGLSPTPNVGNLNAVVVGATYTNARQYPASVSPENGISLGLSVEKDSNDLGSNYSFTNFSSSLNGYSPAFFKHNVLASKLSGFYSRGQQLQQSNFTWQSIFVRGYPFSFAGSKGGLLSLEYRFPINYLETGLGYGATFFDRLWGDFFFDAGGATFGPIGQLNLSRGVGAELNLSLSALWASYGLTLKFGYAHGLDAGGGDNFYLNFAM